MCKWFCTTFSLGAPFIYSTDWLLIMSALAKTYKARAKRRNFLRDEPNSNLSRPKLSLDRLLGHTLNLGCVEPIN